MLVLAQGHHNDHRGLSIKRRQEVEWAWCELMSYGGEERRTVEVLEREVFGNGKPGLRSEVDKINLALYGNKDNQQKGMIDKQEEILKFVYAVRPFLNPKLLLGMFTLSIAACLKVLGADLVGEVVKKLVI